MSGTAGERRTPLRHKIEVLSEHCAAVGRDPATIHKSVQVLWVLEGENDVASSTSSTQPTLRGSSSALAEAFAEYAAAGVDEVIVPDWNFGPVDTRLRIYDRFITEVAAAVR